jgi:hypothetical protein
MGHCKTKNGARWERGAVALGAILFMAPSARAQEGSNGVPSGVTPSGATPVDSGIPARSGTMPPFTAPLPPSVPLPSPIQLVPATPPPQYQRLPTPWTILPRIPERPAAPAPYRPVLESPERNAASAGGLRQALSEYDRRLGLGPSGPVLSAARRAGMSATATGSARFEVVLDHSGTIQSVSLVDASEDLAGWQRFGENFRAVPLRGVRFAETAQGAWMMVDVSARNERLSGEPRWWDYGLTLVFDVANLHPRTQRVVHTSVVSELVF